MLLNCAKHITTFFGRHVLIFILVTKILSTLFISTVIIIVIIIVPIIIIIIFNINNTLLL